MNKTILILGGSSSIAKELITLHKEDFVYYSYHSTIDQQNNSFYLDISDASSYQNIPNKQYDIIYSFLGYTPDINLIDDLFCSRVTIERNFLYPALVLQFILQNQLYNKKARIKVVTSVAGVRGRKLNFIYGASKSGMQTLLEGLANKYPQLKFTDLILGPVYTKAVSKHTTPALLISDPRRVAAQIYRARRQKVYVPFKWQLIMFVIRQIPSPIYNYLTL